MRRTLVLITGCLITLVVVACEQAEPSSSSVQVTQVATRTPTPNAAALRERAESLYRSRIEDDWAAAYELLDPSHRNGKSVEQFAEWAEAEEPFRYQSFTIDEVLVDGEMGWTEVNCHVAMRRFPKLPGRDIERWDKWRVVDDAWYPVPREAIDMYPETPALREAAEEPRLRARFLESWEARVAGDWERLYELSDPRDRELIPMEQYRKQQSATSYLAQDVHWVEVIGERGKVNVSVTHKLKDPSLTKLPPRTSVMSEDWVIVDGQWYLDLG